MTSFSEPVNSPRDDFKKETGELNICENLVFENGFRQYFNLNQGGI